ncbi:MAG TPA: hypothetical protein EYG16_02480, partial [Deltaproteobacteria bacterium]|nr:hypothetical protein [Deltaproteobacteria bacterium]
MAARPSSQFLQSRLTQSLGSCCCALLALLLFGIVVPGQADAQLIDPPPAPVFLDSPTPSTNGGYGRALAELVTPEGRFLVVGAATHYTVAGEHRVYVLGGDGLVVKTIEPPGLLTDPNATNFNGFGSSLAVINGLVAVGAPWAGAVGDRNGKVYLYDPQLDVPGVDAWRLLAIYENTVAFQEFGHKLATVGDDRLLAARPRASSVVDRVYVFAVPPERSCSVSPDSCSSDGDCPSGETCETATVTVDASVPSCDLPSAPPCF